MNKKEQLVFKKNSFLEKELAAKNRELEIEASLERVREKAMAMHASAELKEVVQTLFEELKHLDVNLQACLIATFDAVTSDQRSWIIHSKTNEPYSFLIPYNEQPFYQEMLKAWKEKNVNWSYMLEGEAKTNWENFLFTDTEFKLLPGEVKEEMGKPEKVFFAASYYPYGAIQASSPELLSKASIDILQRFSKVFDSCYTRFLDLQKAESQAREAQIEAALEKVRSRSLAMHHSDELEQVVASLFDRLIELGLSFDGALIFLFDKEKHSIQLWIATVHLSVPVRIDLPFDNEIESNQIIKDLWEAIEQGEHIFNKSYSGETKNAYFRYTTKYNSSKVPESVRNFQIEKESWIAYLIVEKTCMLGFDSWSGPITSITDEDFQVLKRFARVFEQAYTRFLDLQKAEAAAREAQIQLALERVRARTMAMHKSDELREVVAVIYEQLQQLGFVQEGSCNINIMDASTGNVDWWMTGFGNQKYPHRYHVEYINHPMHITQLAEWKSGEKYTTIEVAGESKKEFDRMMLSQADFEKMSDETKRMIASVDKVIFSMAFMKYGALSWAANPITDEQANILQRFAKVFEQTYTRFLDLQKAEAQAKEAQIQLALERVRARTMAMYKSEELAETAGLLFQQIQSLGLPLISCGYNIWEEKDKVCDAYMSDAGGFIHPPFKIPLTQSPVFIHFYNSRQKKEKFYTEQLNGEVLARHYKYMLTLPGFASIADNFLKAGFRLPEFQVNNVANFSHGNLIFITSKEVPEAKDICMRFASVFDQSYTRFLDLQKAEAQAREANIEAALERVRSSSLAMQKSSELKEVITVVLQKLQELGVAMEDRSAVIFVYEEGVKSFTQYVASQEHSSAIELYTPYFDSTILNDFWNARVKGKNFFIKSYSIEEKNEIFNYYFEHTELSRLPEKEKIWLLEREHYEVSVALEKHSAVCIANFTASPLTAENHLIFQRFARVFEQSYVRFLDLQKAEAQAKEAMIEAALERVRAKAMAMHNSNDVSVAASMVFTELRKLGIDPIRCGVGLLNKESRKAQLYSATSTSAGDSLSLVGWVILSGHPVLENIYAAWLKNEDYYPELTGTQLKSYYENLLAGLSLPTVPKWQTGEKQYGHFFSFSVGCLYAWSDRHYNESETKILKRFATIIDLTFRRYIDLQKAEANAKEAVKQSALDRIRADIASMRTISDLDRITPLIWNELTILGVPFIRCGVFIMDDEEQQIHTFLSTPEGKGIAAFHLGYKTPGNIAHVITHWQKKEIYTDHWDEEAFKEFADNLVQQGAMKSSEQYLSTMPAGGFNLHFVPFQQGMLYVGNIAPLDEEEINLLQSIADAFSTAYARYEDFNKLEAAKKQVDKTLAELRQTQQQLVQSEKMASLGELTAGIAHEIQNPLNFVNNFSEVNREMLEELKTERLKPDEERDDDLQNDLINDVIENSEKILHHGKRADAIVKGMLQHSRQSSGQKELTDINVLTDEYLRLSYHGLRAKDKNFNATIETDFDNSLGKINVIPQDIGRVLLNLFNNAFYAVNEQKIQNPISYNPTVFVRTQKCDDKVQITVRDNGNGIPQKIIDKIFQPFFTTKPTGQGTGLGLSLSYDIIKAHGGEIKVESTEGKGSEFAILLSHR
jgi:signal transduction histidine kinase